MKRIVAVFLLSCTFAFGQTSWIFNPHTGKLDAVSIVPSGVPGTWGTIAGFLPNQTDLQSALDLKQPVDADLTAIAGLTTTPFGRGLLDDADAAAVRVTLGATTLGTNIFIAPNPSAVRYMRVNADNSVSLLDAATFLAAIGGSSSAWGTITGTLSSQTDLQAALDAKQPLDSDLTAIASLATTAFGRGLLDDADATAARVSIGVVIGTNVLAPTGDGSSLTGITFTQVGGIATDAQIPGAIARDAEVAAAYQPLDADLSSLAAASATGQLYYRSAAGVWSPVTIGANLTFAGGILAATGGGGGGTWGTITGTLSSQTDLQAALDAKQPLDADLTSLAGASATGQFYYRSAAGTWAPVTIGPNLTFVGGTLSGTGAGGVAWGGISGTLSTQTDLQAALDAKQPLDADLTAIAALTTTTFGRSLLDDANTTAAQATLGLVIGTNVLAPNGDGSGLTGFIDAQIPAAIARDAEVAAGYQPLDSDLTAIAALSTTSFGRSLLTSADNIAARATLGLVVGTDVLAPNGNGSGLTGLTDSQLPATIARDAEVAAAYQPLDADLTSLAGAAATNVFYYRSAAGTWAPATMGSGLSFVGGTLTVTAGGSGTVTATGGALTLNQIVLGAGTVDTKVLGSLGTTTTVLHGNAAGVPSFAPVTFTELSGTIASAQVPTTLDLTGKTLTAGTFTVSTIVGSAGAVGPKTPAYPISAQNNATTSFVEILNNGGSGRGAFLGMDVNDFQLWNFQGGPITFLTGTTPSSSLARVRIETTGELSALANLNVSSGAVGSGQVNIFEDSDFGTNFTRFQVPALASNVIYTLPPNDGNANEYLGTDGGGVLIWKPISGGNATGFFTSGQVERARGGTGIDTSAFGIGLLGSDASNNTINVNSTLKFANALGMSPSAALQTLAGTTLSTFWANTAAVSYAAENTSASGPTGGTTVLLHSNDGAAMASGDRLGGLAMGGSSSATVSRNTVAILAYASQNWVDGVAHGSRLVFENVLNGAIPRTERMALEGNGLITFGGPNATNPALQASGTTLKVRLGDNSADAPISASTGTFSGAVIVPTEVYDATGWNGDLSVPTKDAVRDKIETMGGGATAAGSPNFVQYNVGGGFGAKSTFTFDPATDILSVPNLATTNLNAAAFKVQDSVNQSHGLMFSVATDLVADKAFVYTGPFNFNMTVTGDTNVTFPTTGTLLASGGALGTPSSGILTNATGLPISTGVAGLGTGVATFLATPSSANLRAAVTDEVGTGPAMFTRTGVLRTVYINVGSMIPRTTNGAAPGTIQTTTNGIMYDSFDFDSTTTEGVGFWWTPPTTYNGGTVTLKFQWTAATGTGTSTWAAAARAFGDDDPIDAATGTAQSVTDTLLATGDMHITPTTSALTIAGTPAANKPVYFLVVRDASIGGRIAADTKLLGCTLEYTESATEPSAQ